MFFVGFDWLHSVKLLLAEIICMRTCLDGAGFFVLIVPTPDDTMTCDDPGMKTCAWLEAP